MSRGRHAAPPRPKRTSAIITADPPIEAPDGLARTTARGAVVTIAGQLAQVVLQLASVVVLARLLSPRDYGLYATVLIVVGVGEIFRDFGLSAASIQAKLLSRFQRDNLFWINAALGLALTVIAFAAAPLVATVFHHRQALVSITRALSFTFLINGLATQHRADLNRRFKFGQLAVCDLSGQFFGLTVAVVTAALGAGYWALVASQLTQVSVVLILVIGFARWIPGRPQRGTELRGMLTYGTQFAGTTVVGYIGNNVDTLTAALRFAAAPLGLYTRAFQVIMNPLNQFRSPATTVALPVLSRMQDDLPRANRYLLRGQTAMGYTVVAGLAIAAGAASPIVALLLGPKWHGATPLVALLAAAGIFQMLGYVGYWAYLSRGLTGDLLNYEVVVLVIRIVVIVSASWWGIRGVATGYATAYALEWPLSLWWLGRRTEYPVRELYGGAGRILAVSSLAALAAYATSRGLSSAPSIVAVLAAVVAGSGVYLVAGLVVPRIREDELGVVDVARRVMHRG